MPHSVECLLEVYEYLVEFLLVLKVTLAQNSQIENLLSCAASCLETCLLFRYNCFSLGSQPVQYDTEHHFARMAYQADGAVSCLSWVG